MRGPCLTALLAVLACSSDEPAPGAAAASASSSAGAAAGGSGGEGGSHLDPSSSSSTGGGGSGPAVPGKPWANAVWSREVTIPGGLTIGAMAVSPAGTIYVCAEVSGDVAFGAEPHLALDRDLVLFALDLGGEVIAERVFADPGNDGNCVGIGVQPDGTVVMAGTLRGAVDLGSGLLEALDDDVYVAAFDSSLVPLWSRRFGDGAKQTLFDAAIDAQGNVVLVGRYGGELLLGAVSLPPPETAADDGFVVALDPAGNGLWGWSIGAESQDEVRAVSTAASGEVVLCGRGYGAFAIADGPVVDSEYDGWVARLGADGGYLYQHRMPIESFEPCAVAPLADGGMMLGFGFYGSQVLARTELSAAPLTIDMALARFDGAGGPQAAIELEAPLPPGSLMPFPPQESITDVLVDAQGRVIITGNGPTGLDLGDGPTERVGPYVAAYSSDLGFLWADHHTDVDFGRGVTVRQAPDGDLVVLVGGWRGQASLIMVSKLSYD